MAQATHKFFLFFSSLSFSRMKTDYTLLILILISTDVGIQRSRSLLELEGAKNIGKKYSIKVQPNNLILIYVIGICLALTPLQLQNFLTI